MNVSYMDFTALSDRQLRGALNGLLPGSVSSDALLLGHAVAEQIRRHGGDLRAVRAVFDRLDPGPGFSRVDSLAEFAARNTTDSGISFDLRDVRSDRTWMFDDPFAFFVAHVLLHRDRAGNDLREAETTCRMVLDRGRFPLADAPWEQVLETALVHRDPVVAGAAAAIVISRGASVLDGRMLFARIAEGYADEPLLPAALRMVRGAVEDRSWGPRGRELADRIDAAISDGGMR